MLYDFHQSQNTQKANSVYATYLIYGTKPTEDIKQESKDVEMSEHDMPTEQIHTSTLTLAKEETLHGTTSSSQLLTYPAD